MITMISATITQVREELSAEFSLQIHFGSTSALFTLRVHVDNDENMSLTLRFAQPWNQFTEMRSLHCRSL